MISYKYSSWDGTQQPFELAPEELMDEISKDVLSYGDLQTALRRLMERGMTNREGNRLVGLRNLLNRLRNERRNQLSKYDLDSTFDDLKEKLDDITKKERKGLQNRREEGARKAPEGEDQNRLMKMMKDMLDRKEEFLDNLPKSFGGAIRELSDYEFVDEEARQEFQEMMDLLRQRMLEPYAQNLKQSLQSLTPEQLEAIKDMLTDLNDMLEQQRLGLDPDYQWFMQQYGQFFPGAPDNLEDFVEQLQRQIGQMQSLMNSLSPEARRSLQDLLDYDVFDDDLREELAQLSVNLESLFPSEEFRSLYPFEGEEQVSWDEAMKLMEKLQSIDELERQLEHVRNSKGLDGIDTQKLQEVLGDEARQDVEALKELTKILEEAGYVQRKGNRLELSPKGLRRIGQRALRDIFQHLKKDRQGSHEIRTRGLGVENTDETKTYEFGDSFAVHLPKTLLNAVERAGATVPVELRPEDLEIYRPEHMTRSATVLLLDQSRSMDISGAFLAAKKVALALHSLISTQFPTDDLYVVGFSDYAREIKRDVLAEVGCRSQTPGTNMHHALMLSRQLLSKRKCDNKQVIMVTDGEPTAHLEGGQAFFWYPPSIETIQATLREVKRCTRDSITINVFMLETSYYLVDFVNQLTKINRGRAFYTTPDRLGEHVLVDYMTNKRGKVQP